MRFGNCSGCGRRGVVAWYSGEEEKLKGEFVLTCYGGDYYCCSDECYSRARGIGVKEVQATLSVFLIFTLLFVLPVSADYTIGIQQVQPPQPEPGDIAVFKVTVANEPRWSRVLNARVISPEGIVFELANIRYVDRAGSDIIHSEYVSWEVPKDALEGNYTLEVNTPEGVFISTTFRVFRFPKLAFSDNVLTNFGTAPAKEVEVRATNYYRFLGDLSVNQSLYLDPPPDAAQLEVTYRYGKRYNETFPVTVLPQKLRIMTDFKDNIFYVNMSSEKLIENLELRILSEIPRRIKSINDTHELRYYPISFIVLGQDYLYIGDAIQASARFAISPHFRKEAGVYTIFLAEE